MAGQPELHGKLAHLLSSWSVGLALGDSTAAPWREIKAAGLGKGNMGNSQTENKGQKMV
jgi:hypothetical protein